MDSTLLSRKEAWLDELQYSEALEQATEFSDSYLNQAFADISQRLNAIRAESNPNFFRKVVKAQRLQLQLLRPELEHEQAQEEAARTTPNSKLKPCRTGAADTAQAIPFEFVPQQAEANADHPLQAAPLFNEVSDALEPRHSVPLTPQPVTHKDSYPLDSDAGRISRVPNVQQFIAVQSNNSVLPLDPVSIAQAWVEMYLENERVLKTRQEAQLAKQRRQFQLIATFVSAAILVVYAAVVIYLDVSNTHKLSVASVTAAHIPTPALSKPLLPYQSVNADSTADSYQPISGEVRNNYHNGYEEHPASQVGSNEFSYFDESMYEPDKYADASVEYSVEDLAEAYPKAVSDTEISIDRRESTTSLHEQAYAHWHAGDVAEAKKTYLKILTSNANDTETLVSLGSMAQRAGDTAAAVDYLVRAVKTQPDHAYALAALASLSTAANPGELERDLMTLARKNPEVAQLPFILGNWYARAKRWPDAQKAYFDAYNRNSENADYAYNLAIALDQIGQSATAEPYYRKAISLAAGGIAHFDIESARTRAEQLASL